MRGNNSQPHVSTKTAHFGQYLIEFLMELPQTTTNHDMDHYKWWHESSQITINHHKFSMIWIPTNHKSLQITTNHDRNQHKAWHESLQITTNHDMNHHDDPKRALHKAIWLPCYCFAMRLGSHFEIWLSHECADFCWFAQRLSSHYGI